MYLNNLRKLIILIFITFLIGCKEESSTESFVKMPTVTTNNVTTITDSSAIISGKITDKGDSEISSKGICWSVNPLPTVADNKIVSTTNSDEFSCTITGLNDKTGYYVRAFATNKAGTAYGNVVSFTTSEAKVLFFGLDSVKIFNLLDLIANKTFPEIDGLLIMKDDSLIIEKYYNAYKRTNMHTMQSVTKSFTSALLGIALDKGIINSVDSKILSYFPQYTNIQNMNDWKRAITIKNLITMKTGVDYSEGFPNSPHDQLNALRTGWDQFYLNRPMAAEPGLWFNYDSGGVILLSAILKSAWGNHADVFADQYLFPKLGITTKSWIKNSEGHPHTGGGLYLRPIDMIKLGQLYLNKGKYKGEQIISESWITESFKMKVDLTPVYVNDPYIRGYGYLWWIFKPGIKSKTNEYVYAAMGAMGQYIFVIPEYKMVVAVTATTTTNENFQNPQRFLYDYILDAVK